MFALRHTLLRVTERSSAISRISLVLGPARLASQDKRSGSTPTQKKQLPGAGDAPVTNKEIFGHIAHYIWPKGDSRLKLRVASAVGLLLAAKV